MQGIFTILCAHNATDTHGLITSLPNQPISRLRLKTAETNLVHFLFTTYFFSQGMWEDTWQEDNLACSRSARSVGSMLMTAIFMPGETHQESAFAVADQSPVGEGISQVMERGAGLCLVSLSRAPFWFDHRLVSKSSGLSSETSRVLSWLIAPN